MVLIYGDSEEKKRFFSSVSKEIEDLLTSEGVTVYVQGAFALEEIENAVFAFPSNGLIKEYVEKVLTECTTIEKPKRITVNFSFLENTEYDNFFITIPRKYRETEFYDERGILIGIIDVAGNLHLTDFYHYSRPYPQLLEIFSHFLKKNYILHEKIINEIKNLTAVKIIEVKTEFDREAYLKKVEEKIKQLGRQYEARITVLKKSFEQQVRSLQERLDEEREEGFLEGIKFFEKFQKNWKVDEPYLKYKKVIYAKQIKYRDKIYKLPTSLQKKFYIKGLKVYIRNKLYNGDVSYSRRYHPNAYDGIVCLGTLEGKPLSEVLEKLPTLLETINLDSAYSYEATSEAMRIVNDNSLEEVSSVWTA